jgi:hypothetical protein
MPYLTQCYKRTKNTCHRTRSVEHQHDTDFKIWNVKRNEAIEHDDWWRVTTLEASICIIICKNLTFKQKP